MKTILFLFHVSSIGGGSYCLLNILKEIDRTCLRPIVLLKNEGPLADEIRKLGIAVFFLPSLTQVPYNRSLCRFSSVKAYVGVKKSLGDFSVWLKDTDVDIIYINTMMLYPYLKVAKQLGKKTVIHIRECWPKNEHKKQLKWAQDAIVKYADQIVAINQRSAAIVPLAKDKTTIVYDWIDFSERYEPISLHEIFGEDISDKKIYLFTGGMVRIKGGYQVLKCFTEKIKGNDKRLLFMGYDMNKPTGGFKGFLKRALFKLGYDIYELKIRQIVANDKRIRCMPATYKLVDIINQSYCMLSYFTIPHANLAMAESLILGTPVVAAWTEEAVEYSQGASHVRLFEMNDMESFIDAVHTMNKMIQETSPEPAKELEALFSRDYNVDILSNLFKSL